MLNNHDAIREFHVPPCGSGITRDEDEMMKDVFIFLVSTRTLMLMRTTATQIFYGKFLSIYSSDLFNL
jgi:hypothetical protein